MGGSDFKSFKDLLRSKGGGDGDPEPQEPQADEGGWTLETDEGDWDPEEFAQGADLRGAARERILKRPRAFAPMAHGPECYADVESDYGPNAGDDLPVGLTNTITANAAGTGDFSVMLRHLPELNGEAQKVAGLAEDFAAGEALPGDPDVDITFSLTVQ